MSSFEKQIQQWVAIDNQLRILNEKVRVLREQKAELADSLTTYADSNNLNDATIQISDGKLKFVATKVQTPLTFKHLETSLTNVIPDAEKVQQLVKHIKNTRESKIVYDIKRYTNK
jgi:hypothetical protein